MPILTEVAKRIIEKLENDGFDATLDRGVGDFAIIEVNGRWSVELGEHNQTVGVSVSNMAGSARSSQFDPSSIFEIKEFIIDAIAMFQESTVRKAEAILKGAEPRVVMEQEVPDQFRFNSKGDAEQKAKDMYGINGIHSHNNGNIWMPGSSHQELVDHLKAEGVLEQRNDFSTDIERAINNHGGSVDRIRPDGGSFTKDGNQYSIEVSEFDEIRVDLRGNGHQSFEENLMIRNALRGAFDRHPDF